MIATADATEASDISSADYVYFKRRVQALVGIDLESYKPAQMYRRLKTLMERSNVQSFTEFSRVLEKDPEKLREFEDFVTINFSEYFRNPEKFEVLRHTVLKELLAERPNLRIWSAGCSYGAEPYTLAILLATMAPRGRHYILATDVDERTLARGRAAATYSDDDLRNVPAALTDRFFSKTLDGRYWQLSSDIRSMVTFRTHDLLKNQLESDFDLIVCRNVAIYFTDTAKQKLYRRLYDALRLGGYLFVGGTEIMTNAAEMGFSSELLSFYRKVPLNVKQGELTSAH